MILTTVETIGNFLKTTLNKVFTEGNEFPSVTYETPPAVVKYMEMQSALGNPPWKIKGKRIRKYKK
jgi:hypothetical protein